MKKFILNADDLGKSEFHNNAVIEGFKKGYLQSASLMTNTAFFEDAVHRVVEPFNSFDIGVHLNIIEGLSISDKLSTLCNKHNQFNNGYGALILKSYLSKKFLSQVEIEFRRQIEKALKHFQPTHIDSHVHTHAIPPIFKIVCELAMEYGINQVRTQHEVPYYIESERYDSKAYFINQLKVRLLNYFTIQNKKTLRKYNLKTNDYLVGVSYTGMMNSETIFEGLNVFKDLQKSITVEALIHPCQYFDDTKDTHSIEFDITQDDELFRSIQELGFFVTNYI